MYSDVHIKIKAIILEVFWHLSQLKMNVIILYLKNASKY